MNKKILYFLLLAAVVAMPVIALGQSSSGSSTGPTLSSMATSVSNAAIDIATPIIVIGWIIAGILWLTSAGAPDKMGVAKKAIMACVIGTVLVVLAITSTMIVDVVKNAFGITDTTSTT